MNTHAVTEQRSPHAYKFLDLSQHDEREAYWQKWRISRQRKFLEKLRRRQAEEVACWAALVAFISLNSSVVLATRFGSMPWSTKWIGFSVALIAPFLVYFVFRYAWVRMKFNDVDAWQRAMMYDRDVDQILRDN